MTKRRRSSVGILTLLVPLALALVSGTAVAGNGWGNDRVPDTNDATCDDDEGTGNDAKCMGTSDGTVGMGGGHGWGNDRVPDANDATCDDDEGTGNDWKCLGTSKK